jgi:hypothetical protein
MIEDKLLRHCPSAAGNASHQYQDAEQKASNPALALTFGACTGNRPAHIIRGTVSDHVKRMIKRFRI